MADNEKLIKMLESPKDSDRYEACELLRVSPSISDTALAALEKVADDADPSVREAAQNALNFHKVPPTLPPENAIQASQGIPLTEQQQSVADIPMTQQQMNYLAEKMKIENRFKGGTSWFFWIAGFSMLNSLIVAFGANLNFLVGLGLTQYVDWSAYAIALELNSNIGTVIRIFALLISLGIASIFIACGVLARKRRKWAYILGLVLFALDSLILLAFQDWFGVVFHGLALVGLYSGWTALKKLEIMENSQPFPVPA